MPEQETRARELFFNSKKPWEEERNSITKMMLKDRQLHSISITVASIVTVGIELM